MASMLISRFTLRLHSADGDFGDEEAVQALVAQLRARLTEAGAIRGRRARE